MALTSQPTDTWANVMQQWEDNAQEDMEEDEEEDWDGEEQGDDDEQDEAEEEGLADARQGRRRHCKGGGKGPGPGIRHPFDPYNACCNAPCPPGAFCNDCDCDKPTEFYVQKWTCVWQQSPLYCCKGKGKGKPDEACAWTKAWRCNFHRICREDVLKVFRCGQAQRCPEPCGGESDCFVPQDTYFAKVYEIGYELCDKYPWPEGECFPVREGRTPCGKCLKVGGCACCGLFKTCKERWVRIRCKAEIPPLLPYEPPLPFYERPDCEPKRRNYCQCVTCAPAVARSPNLRGLSTQPFA